MMRSKLSLILFGCFLRIIVQAADIPFPNIVFILADDLGYGDLSCNGQTKFATPNIDSLSHQGMSFTRCYSGSSVCAPSRCSLLTGLHTGHAPIRGNAELYPEGQAPMPENTYTVSLLLKQAGYKTGAFGKWGLGAPGTVSAPLNAGFDRFYGYNCQRLAHSYYPYFLWNDNCREILWNNFGFERGDYAPDFIHKAALDFIRTNKDRPFFCYYAAVQPHAELLAPLEYIRKYQGKFLPEKSFNCKIDSRFFRKGAYASQSEVHAAYAAMINVLDDYVGDLLREIEDLGIASNTVVVFASDNGPAVEGGSDPEYFNSNGSFRGFKRDLYEGGIHVPFIVSWPGKIPAGSKSDHLTSFWDFLPTVAELTGQSLPQTVDGISILPTLLVRPGQKEHDFLYWEFHEEGGRIAVLCGYWKGIRYRVDENPDSPLELYNLSTDLDERINVSAQHPEVVAKLDQLIKAARTPSSNSTFNFSVPDPPHR